MAVALMIGFYTMALAIVCGLLWIPYAEWMYAERLHARLAFMCIAGAGAVLWALAPRPDRFDPPGPRVEASTHPRLFRLIHEVASRTGQAMPAEVYLLNEVNAWVSQRGGVMGFGSRRVMGIGLPLLQALSQAELKAVIAHEFGHYAGGDVKLGPWIYKTRGAIGRSIANLNEGWLAKPFQWYGTMFLKLTHAVSREQEFSADRVAASVAGAPAAASALRRVTALAPAFTMYLRGEVTPVMQAGFLPPISSGFARFLESPQIAAVAAAALHAEEDEGTTDPFDTHPSLKERLAALNAPAPAAPESADPAVTLISDADAQARVLIEQAIGEDARSLKALAWDDVAESVYIARWRQLVKQHESLLNRFIAEGLPSGATGYIELGAALVSPGEEPPSADIRVARASYLLGAAIGVALVDRGWRAHTSPGMPVILTFGNDTFDPVEAVGRLTRGVGDPAEWADRCRILGIAGLSLGASNSAAMG